MTKLACRYTLATILLITGFTMTAGHPALAQTKASPVLTPAPWSSSPTPNAAASRLPLPTLTQAGPNSPSHAKVQINPNDPDVANLLPVGIAQDPTHSALPGSIMTTIRAYVGIIENCVVTSKQASCSLHGTGNAKLENGTIVIVNWTYATNVQNKPILLLTVQGHPDEATGLSILYGGDAHAQYMTRVDLVGALTSGAKLLKATEIGCSENCVYGVGIQKFPGFSDWLMNGDAIGFRFLEDGALIELSSPLTGFKDATAAMQLDRTRRLNPGTTGPADVLPTPQQLNNAPDSLKSLASRP